MVKIGTSSLVDPGIGIKLSTVAALMEVVARLKKSNHSVLLVTSGAVGTGARELGIQERPTTSHEKQALAAVGQVRLMRELNSMLATLGFQSGQVLLTIGNFQDSLQRENAHHTIIELFKLGVVPIVNENDVVATEKERFGDNDQLSALVSTLIEADMLFLITDVDGLYSANPNIDPNAHRIEMVDDLAGIRAEIHIDDGPGSTFSTGGMGSKLEAVKIAVSGGVRTTIMSAEDIQLIPSFVDKSSSDFSHVAVPSFGTIFVETTNKGRGK